MRHRRVWRLVLSGAALALALGFVALVALTRTDWGRGRVLGYTLRAVGGRLNGVLVVKRLDGNLITGARLYGIELRGRDGERVVRADSAYADYELPSFFGGDVVLRRLVLYNSEVSLSRLPGDSLWNYQKILLDTTKVPGTTASRATLIRSARFVDAKVTVRAPWEPAKYLSPRERAQAIRDALADTSRLEVTRAPGGYLRRMDFQVADARTTDLVIAGDDRGGTYLRVDSAAARAMLYRGKPLVVRDVRGELSFHDGVVRYRMPRVVLPASTVTSVGTIDMRQPEPLYDLTVDVPHVTLTDMEWLFPQLPQGGEAAFRMSLETRKEGTLYRFTGLRFTAPGTRLVGSFGVLMDGTLQFTDVNLTAAPLRVRTIEEMLPSGLPVRGLQIGEVEIHSSGAATRPAGAPPRG
jgi:hypothetical protein